MLNHNEDANLFFKFRYFYKKIFENIILLQSSDGMFSTTFL